jgi:putative two-component system response regulator
MRKNILIVDDSDIDITILTEILSRDFNVVSRKNGYSTVKYLLDHKQAVDCILMDIKMPVLDGFEILDLMEDNDIRGIPVFMCTVEATIENVQRASNYAIEGFIAKPYTPETVLSKVHGFFGTTPTVDPEPEPEPELEETVQLDKNTLTEAHLEAIDAYILRLTNLYNDFLIDMHKSNLTYLRIVDLFSIVYKRYTQLTDINITNEQLDICSKAVYFYDIGKMIRTAEHSDSNLSTVPGSEHTQLGANIICLNDSPLCKYFVDCCSEICLYHHERWDGKGYPHHVKGEDIPVRALITGMLIEFDKIFVNRPEYNAANFDFTVNELSLRKLYFGDYTISILNNCKTNIIRYYINNYLQTQA